LRKTDGNLLTRKVKRRKGGLGKEMAVRLGSLLVAGRYKIEAGGMLEKIVILQLRSRSHEGKKKGKRQEENMD